MSNGVQSNNQNNGASNFTQVTYDPTNRPTLFNRRLDGVQLIIATMSVIAFIVTVALVITILAVGLDHPTSDKTLVFSDNQYCSKLGKDLLINDIGNIFDAGVLLALCRAMTSPKTSGLLGGGVAMLTNMRTNVNDGLFWEFLPERPRGNRNLSEEQRKNLRFIPGTIKGLHHMSIRGKLTFPRILEFLYQFGEPTAVGTLSQDTKSILNSMDKFYNNKTLQEFIFSKEGSSIFTPVDYNDYNVYEGTTQRLLFDKVIVDSAIGPFAGTELFQLLSLIKKDGKAFNPEINKKYVKYAYLSYEGHNKIERDLTAERPDHDFTKDDKQIHDMFMADQTIDKLKNNLQTKLNNPNGISPIDVDSITIMHQGLSLQILLTMGKAADLTDNGPFDTGHDKFYFPSFDSQIDLINTDDTLPADSLAQSPTNKNFRPVMPYAPIYIKPTCGVCSLQAAISLQFRKTYKVANQMPLISQLQMIQKLNRIHNEELAGISSKQKSDYFNSIKRMNVDFLGVAGQTGDKLQMGTTGLNANDFGVSSENIEGFSDDILINQRFDNLPLLMAHHGDFGYMGFEYFNETSKRFQ